MKNVYLHQIKRLMQDVLENKPMRKRLLLELEEVIGNEEIIDIDEEQSESLKELACDLSFYSNNARELYLDSTLIGDAKVEELIINSLKCLE